MPKIFIYFGYLIYIYVDDHLPVHVHVKKDDQEMRFVLLYNNGILTVTVEKIKGKKALADHQITEMRKFVRKYADKIKEQWEVIHYYKKKAKVIHVRRRV